MKCNMGGMEIYAYLVSAHNIDYCNTMGLLAHLTSYICSEAILFTLFVFNKFFHIESIAFLVSNRASICRRIGDE